MKVVDPSVVIVGNRKALFKGSSSDGLGRVRITR